MSLVKEALDSSTKGALIGGAIGAPIGGFVGYHTVKGKIDPRTGKKYTSKDVTRYALSGALGYGLSGAYLGHTFGRFHDAANRASSSSSRGGAWRPTASYRDHLKTLGLDDPGSITKKEQVRKHFLRLAMKHHPDRGGSEEKMKEINEAWSGIQKTRWFEKLNFLMKKSTSSAIQDEERAKQMLDELRSTGKAGGQTADILAEWRKQILAREAAKKLGNAYAQGGQLHFDYKDLGLKKR